MRGAVYAAVDGHDSDVGDVMRVHLRLSEGSEGSRHDIE